MVEWSITERHQSVLDPSFGDGAFLKCAAKRLLHLGADCASASKRVHGVDLDLQAVKETSMAVKSVLQLARINARNGSFFEMAHPGATPSERAVDVVLGNPPYIRYQHFNGSMRERALRRATEAGETLGQLTQSWAPRTFLTLASQQRA